MHHVYKSVLNEAKKNVGQVIFNKGITGITPVIIRGCVGRAFREQLGINRAGQGEFRIVHKALMKTPINEFTR